MKRALKFILLPAACCILTMVLFRVFFFIGYVPTASMEPTIRRGTFIVADRTAYWIDTPKSGDIIVFERNGRMLIKRIIAVGGEIVYCSDHVMIVPESCVYVRGDNIKDSVDSDDWEEPYVSVTSIVARCCV